VGRLVHEGFEPPHAVDSRTRREILVFEPISVQDGILDIGFLRRRENPMIAAIEVERIDW
jgi:hypothetical protein